MVCPNKLLLQQFLSMYVEVILVAIPLNALKKAKSVISNQLILLEFIYWDSFSLFSQWTVCVYAIKIERDRERERERHQERGRKNKKESFVFVCQRQQRLHAKEM